MQSLFPVLFFIVIITIILAGIIYNNIQQRKRREGLFELAQRLNLDYDGGQNYGIETRFGFLKQLEQGDNRYATNVISGNYQQKEVLAFDYHYETVVQDKNGSHKEDHWFSFFILTMPMVFPDLTIRRENIFTKVAEVFGYQDIKFESAEFSKTFNVRCQDKKFAYDVCNAKMMEYLLANRDLSIEIENEVIALAFNTRISVEQFESNLQHLAQIRSLLPDYLFTQTT